MKVVISRERMSEGRMPTENLSFVLFEDAFIIFGISRKINTANN